MLSTKFLLALGLGALCVVTRGDDFGDVEDDGEGFGDGDDLDYGGGGYGGDDGGYGGYGGGMGDDEYGGGGGDTSPAYEVVDSFGGIATFVHGDEQEPSVVGFFDEDRDADALATFKSLAEDMRYDMRFAYVTDDAARDAAKLAKGPAVHVYPAPQFVSDKYDARKRHRYPAKTLEAGALKKFVIKHSVPLVAQKTWKSNERYAKQGLPTVTLFAAVDLEKNVKGFEYFANRLRKVAVDFSGKLVFNIADKEDFSYQLDDYDLKLESKKDVGVGAKDGEKHYHMADKFNVDNLRAFCEQLVAGELVPKIKEEPDYSDYGGGDDDAGGDDSGDMYAGSDVISLTADTFASVTAGKDAMLEFYAPWCGHCKQLKPIYKDLAAEFAEDDGVVVAAMDATAHDPPAEMDVSGYPTLVFRKADGSTTPYDGGRDLDAMVTFIKEHATQAPDL
jgi:protein disulfide isomerase